MSSVSARPSARVRARLPTDERRAQLLALGRRLFVEKAYDELSIDDIAVAAGISKGLLYHYFPSKRRFYVETVREAAAELLARTEPPRGLSPELRLDHGVDAYLSYVAEHGPAYRALLTSGIGVDEEMASIVDRTRTALADRILAELGEPPAAVRVALRGWIGFVEASSLEWLARGAPSRDAVRKLVIETLHAALAAAATLAR